MSSEAVERDLVGLERRYWRAMQDKDVEAIRDLTDFPCTIVGAQGVATEKLTVEGRSVAIDAADSSVWVRRDGHWRCTLHTESIAGDSFGRDRQPAG